MVVSYVIIYYIALYSYPNQQMQKIFVIDDHISVTHYLKDFIGQEMSQLQLEVFRRAEELLGRLVTVVPDLLIADINLPDMNGLDLVVRVRERNPQMRTLIYTMAEHGWLVEKIRRMGIEGLVFKTCDSTELGKALEALLEGKTYYCQAAKDLLFEQSDVGLKPTISTREQEILSLMAKGLTSKQIGQRLHLSQDTIDWYRKALLQKFDSSNSTEMLLKAVKQGIEI